MCMFVCICIHTYTHTHTPHKIHLLHCSALLPPLAGAELSSSTLVKTTSITTDNSVSMCIHTYIHTHKIHLLHCSTPSREWSCSVPPWSYIHTYIYTHIHTKFTSCTASPLGGSGVVQFYPGQNYLYHHGELRE